MLAAELNSASNGDKVREGGHRSNNRGLGPNTGSGTPPMVFLADVYFLICVGSLVVCVRYRIKVCIE